MRKKYTRKSKESLQIISEKYDSDRSEDYVVEKQKPKKIVKEKVVEETTTSSSEEEIKYTPKKAQKNK